MKNNIETFTDQELLDEVKSRIVIKRMTKDLASDVPINITPYQIICKMIEQGWEENPAKGESDPRIDKMWKYLGYPKFTDDESYCAATVNVCLKLAGYETSEVIPVSRSFESYGKRVDLSEAVTGDIVTFQMKGSSWKGHVGFLAGVTRKDSVMVAGGNQNNKMCSKLFAFNGDRLVLTGFRRISEVNRVAVSDRETLKKWGLL